VPFLTLCICPHGRYGRLADPDGYLVEVREDAKLAPTAKRLFKMRMNVLDIEESVAFYRDVAGMTVLRRRSNVYSVPKVQCDRNFFYMHALPFCDVLCVLRGQDASMCAYLGYADEAAGPYLELHYNYATDKLDMGNGFRRAVLQVSQSFVYVHRYRGCVVTVDHPFIHVSRRAGAEQGRGRSQGTGREGG
jgi:hypothetical protein